MSTIVIFKRGIFVKRHFNFFMVLFGTALFFSCQSRVSDTELSVLLSRKLHEFYKHKKVLVTGGCGFIGSHICERLVGYGAIVTVLDNLSTGSVENIQSVSKDIRLLVGDICSWETCLEVTQDQDIVFHLAAFISVPQSLLEPSQCHRVNIDGLANILEAVRVNKVPRFIFSSSAAVYGLTEGGCSEHTPTNPMSPYGFSKLIGEHLCKQYSLNFGIETVMLRYFNVFGPRQDPKGPYAAVVARFTHQLNEGKPITIFGDGLQTRDFVHVERIADANVLAGMLDARKVSGEVFNIATGKSISLLELLESLKAQYPHSGSVVSFLPERVGEIRHSSADVGKFEKLTLEC
jgi:UDP-glucose 4-epimerase